MAKPKENIMHPAAIQAMATETRSNSRLYSKTTDNGEIVSNLVKKLAEELTEIPQKIDLRDTEMVTKVAIMYLDACSKTGIIPSKIGYCRACGVSRQAVDHFMNYHADTPSAERLRIIFDSFAEMLNNAALGSAVHPIVSIFLSKAIYNYSDTVKIESTPAVDPLAEKTDISAIIAQYENMGGLPD